MDIAINNRQFLRIDGKEGIQQLMMQENVQFIHLLDKFTVINDGVVYEPCKCI